MVTVVNDAMPCDWDKSMFRVFLALCRVVMHVQVSLWDGFVMGGGVGVSMGSRFRVTTERAMFAMPETGEQGKARHVRPCMPRSHASSMVALPLSRTPSFVVVLCMMEPSHRPLP
jgi:hypothetical protein